MASVSLDLHFAKLIKNYLDHASSITAGVPTTTVLPRVVGKAGAGDKKSPQATITVTLEPQGKAGVLNIVVNVTGTLTTALTQETLSGYQKLIADRLADANAWYTWLATQTLSDRTGFRIMRWGTPSTPDLQLEGADRELQCQVYLRVSLARYTVTAD